MTASPHMPGYVCHHHEREVAWLSMERIVSTVVASGQQSLLGGENATNGHSGTCDELPAREKST